MFKSNTGCFGAQSFITGACQAALLLMLLIITIEDFSKANLPLSHTF